MIRLNMICRIAISTGAFVMMLLLPNINITRKTSEKTTDRRNNGCVDLSLYRNEYDFSLKRAVSVVSLFKRKTQSKVTNFNHIFTGDMDNKNRTYQKLIEMLSKDKVNFCEDIFTRNLEIPWTQSQRHREDKFKNAVQEIIRDEIRKTKKVGMLSLREK